MYRIKLSAQARKEVKLIRIRYQETLDAAFEEIKDNPFAGKPLVKELTGRFSYKVGVFRIIYKINTKDKIVQVITAGHRSRIYK